METGLPPSIRIFKFSRGWPLCIQWQLREFETTAAGKDATHRASSYFLIKCLLPVSMCAGFSLGIQRKLFILSPAKLQLVRLRQFRL